MTLSDEFLPLLDNLGITITTKTFIPLENTTKIDFFLGN